MLARDKTGPANDNVVVHLFEWSWKDVARECEDLGRWGYWGVQVRLVGSHNQAWLLLSCTICPALQNKSHLLGTNTPCGISGSFSRHQCPSCHPSPFQVFPLVYRFSSVTRVAG